MLVGLLQNGGILPRVCPTCGGAGRLVQREKFWRRRACPTCQGTGRSADDDSVVTMAKTMFSARVTPGRAGLSNRQSVQASIAASPAGNHELYPRGSIVVCVSCAQPVYRLERSIYIGERAGRSADAYRPVRVADLLELRDREDIDAGLRASLNGRSHAELQAICDRITPLRAGAPLACPLCTHALVFARSTEQSETIDRGYVIELVTIPPKGHRQTVLTRGAKYARSLAGIRR